MPIFLRTIDRIRTGFDIPDGDCSSTPIRAGFLRGVNLHDHVTVDPSSQFPLIAFNNIAVWADRAIGPTLSSVHEFAITPYRLTRP